MKISSVTIPFEEGSLSGIWTTPDKATAQFIFAHGAGAGMQHPFMESFSMALANTGIASLRWNFPYMEKGSKRPDSPKKAMAAWAAIASFAEQQCDLPLYLGGKSFGGRMASLTAAEGLFPTRTQGLIFVGFPLHAAGKPGTQRASHLSSIPYSMLFLQGTRDTLASLDLLEPLVSPLDKATLSVFEGADHSFKTLKRSGISEEDVQRAMIDATAQWIDQIS